MGFILGHLQDMGLILVHLHGYEAYPGMFLVV